MTLRLNGSTSGYTEIDAPAVAGNNLLTLPTGNGTADQALVTNGSGALSWGDRGRMTLATAQNSTSGTSIDFTGIPSWAKRVTVMLNGVSTNGSSPVQIQIGSGSFVTSGYAGSSTVTTTTTNYSAGFVVHTNLIASTVAYIAAILVKVDGNTWLESHSASSASNGVAVGNGGLNLSGTLDRVRITTVNGTDTFDAGSINILYEG